MKSRFLLGLSSLATCLLLSGCATPPLWDAAFHGYDAEVRRLISQGADLNESSGPRDATPLMIAAAVRGDLNIAKQLLEAGADVNHRSKYGDTALAWAVWRCKPEIVQLLLEKGADANTQHEGPGSTPLMLGVECDGDAIVKMLLTRGAKLDTENKSGMRALHGAVRKGNPQAVKALLDAGASLDEALRSVAVYYAPPSPPSGYDPYAKVPEQRTVGATYCRSDRPLMVVFCRSDPGWTPLMIAVEEGHAATVAVLLEAGANANTSNQLGETALLRAVKSTRYDIVTLLVKHRADVNIADKSGKTALTYALGAGLEEIASVLRQAGAKK